MKKCKDLGWMGEGWMRWMKNRDETRREEREREKKKEKQKKKHQTQTLGL